MIDIFFSLKIKISQKFKFSRVNAIILLRKNLISAKLELKKLENQALNQELDQVLGIFSKLSERQKIKDFIDITNISSDIIPMKNFFDMIIEKEIFKYKVKCFLIQFFSQLDFNQLSEQEQAEVKKEKKELEYIRMNYNYNYR